MSYSLGEVILKLHLIKGQDCFVFHLSTKKHLSFDACCELESSHGGQSYKPISGATSPKPFKIIVSSLLSSEEKKLIQMGVRLSD